MNKFTKGILLGICLAVAVMLIVAVISRAVCCGSDDSIVDTGAIEILSQRLQFQDEKPYVMGMMSNTTSGLEKVLIQASFFNGNGDFIDKNHEYVRHMSPQETFAFKIGLYQSYHKDLGTNLDYTLKITQGFKE